MENKKSFFTPEERKKLVTQFKLNKPLYSRLCKEIVSILKFYLENNLEIKVAALTHRIKEESSFLGKLDRKPYKKPFDEIDDFAGVRVVLYRATDIPKIEEFLESELDVLEIDNKTEKLGISEMGYGGTHLIVKLGDNYSKGIKHREICELRCEIQIRTVLQDAWSTMSHSLSYKTSLTMPKKMQRDFNNLAALLEVADAGFERIVEDKKRLSINAKGESKKSDFLLMPITIERLSEYSRMKFPELSVSDFWQEKLVTDLNNIEGFQTLNDIEFSIGKAKVAVVKYKNERPDLFKYSTDYLTKSIGFVSKQFREIHPFADAILDAFSRYEDLLC